LVFGKLLPPVFRRNAETISSGDHQATAAKVEAERKLQEAVTKTGNLEREIAEFRGSGATDAAAEVDRLRAATVLDVGKFARPPKAEMEAAERAARIELKNWREKLPWTARNRWVAADDAGGRGSDDQQLPSKALEGRPN